jgi:hypothetical protein
MNKFEMRMYDLFSYIMVGLIALVSITVPLAIIFWAVKWILITCGVVG